MKQYRWFHGSNLGEAIINEHESDIKRTVGIPGSLVKPGRSYLDVEGGRVEISGYSGSDGGYLGFDSSGVCRVYDETGRCITLPTGQSNVDREIKGKMMPRNPRFDLKLP